MYDAALNRGMREYSLGAFLQSAHAIHGQDAKILNAASPQLVEDLHPGMLALRLVDPEAKDILAAVDVIGKHDIDGHLLDAILRAQRYVDAVDESKWIERLERTIPPCLDLFHDAACDGGDLFM